VAVCGVVDLRVAWAIMTAGTVALLLGGCASTASLSGLIPARAHGYGPAPAATAVAEVGGGPLAAPSAMDGLIAKYAATYRVPESLIRRIIVRESGYNPRARNGPYYGLMQIRYDTARSMGYRGTPAGLLDADTNLRYGVKYLSGAYLVSEGNSDGAVRNYARGYYYQARAKGLLADVGLD